MRIASQKEGFWKEMTTEQNSLRL